LGIEAPPSPRPPAVVKGDDAEEWLTGVLGGEMSFLSDTKRKNEHMNGSYDALEIDSQHHFSATICKYPMCANPDIR